MNLSESLLLEIDRALWHISGDPNRCCLAMYTGDCPFHRDYTCHTVLADVEEAEA